MCIRDSINAEYMGEKGAYVVGAEEQQTGVPTSITILVTPAQADVIANASLNGSLYFTLRNPVDTNITVSYTHLRAHETRHDLVCRLLLEKKKKRTCVKKKEAQRKKFQSVSKIENI
eukprot:TRINITY_DN11964_c0_g1_i2.p2 TRINITY_DN11964_c0_g1~~TRINITY_DN11964_c0_g1_i2.p2  ORF type:complete len:117 (-),score=12.83 TRINITY_DN11964_c0_g1_i2:6-356(-)